MPGHPRKSLRRIYMLMLPTRSVTLSTATQYDYGSQSMANTHAQTFHWYNI